MIYYLVKFKMLDILHLIICSEASLNITESNYSNDCGYCLEDIAGNKYELEHRPKEIIKEKLYNIKRIELN